MARTQQAALSVQHGADGGAEQRLLVSSRVRDDFAVEEAAGERHRDAGELQLPAPNGCKDR